MTSTPVLNDGSVTFSLVELGRLEEERVREERKATERRRAAEVAERAEIERRGELEREARARANDALAREERRRAQEQSAQIEAIKMAILEKARAEASEQAKADAREHEHRRELELTAMARGHVEKRLWRIVMAQAIGFAVVAIFTAVAYGAVVAPGNGRRLAQASAEVSLRNETIASLSAQISSRDAEIADLHGALARATERTEPSATSHDAEQHRDDRPRRPIPAPAAHRSPDTGFDTHCEANSPDPLCARLGR